jgi:hypothetical protein
MPGGILKIRHPAYTQMPLITPYLVYEPGKKPERRQKMLKPAEGPTTVAILGENPVVGNALESLLRSTDFAARFFSEYLPTSAEPFEGARVALILPALSSKRNEALIAGIRSHPATVDLPVIELITAPNGRPHEHIRLPWPCGLEELIRNIEAALPQGCGSQL